MIPVFFESPLWVTIVITVLGIAVGGYMSVNDDGKVEGEAIGATVFLSLILFVLWQIAIAFIIAAGVIYIPFKIGMLIRHAQLAQKVVKEEEENGFLRKNSDLLKEQNYSNV